jgi:2-dehydro-3-deoxygluconokinase
MIDLSLPTRDATSIGEGQLRLNTTLGSPLEQTRELSVTVAGTEGNVMGLLARLGNNTGIVTCLPASSLGRRVINEYRAAGIDTDAVVWRDTGRLALYFLERASPPIPSRVVYDRTASCFTQLCVDEVDWGYLADSRLIHLTGLTASLGENTLAIVNEAAERARNAGQQVSIDVNYRVQLSTPAQARERLTPLLAAADVISCSKRDAEIVFGIDGDATHVAEALAHRFGAHAVLVSDGPRPAAAVADGTAFSAEPPVTTVVDRVGAGDALIGGFLHGHLHNDPELGLSLGVAAAALALTHHGDQVHTTLDELRRLSASFGSDIIR